LQAVSVDIEIGGKKVSWNLSVSKPQAETTGDLLAAGTYSYKIKAKPTLLIKRKSIPYQASGQGRIALKDGDRILYTRDNPNAMTNSYDGILKKP
jgi:hypothetical protein